MLRVDPSLGKVVSKHWAKTPPLSNHLLTIRGLFRYL